MQPLTYPQAATLGVTPAQLRSRGWTSPAHNAYLPSADADDLGRRCLATQLVLPPEAVFTHLTAASLRQWWLPDVSWPHLIASATVTRPISSGEGSTSAAAPFPRSTGSRSAACA